MTWVYIAIGVLVLGTIIPKPWWRHDQQYIDSLLDAAERRRDDA